MKIKGEWDSRIGNERVELHLRGGTNPGSKKNKRKVDSSVGLFSNLNGPNILRESHLHETNEETQGLKGSQCRTI